MDDQLPIVDSLESHKFLGTVRDVIQIATDHLETHSPSVEDADYKDRADLVTAADKEIEAKIKHKLSCRYPAHQLIGEETERKITDSPYTWIIDPIDGTTNYLYGLPYYSISVALTDSEGVLVGGVYAPELDDFYYAVRGRGAYRNTDKITASERPYSDGVYFCEQQPPEQHSTGLQEIQRQLLQETNGVRDIHSGALSLCLVAEGVVDGCVLAASVWDIAAATLIIEEAGGVVTDWNGRTEWEAVKDGRIAAGTQKANTPLTEACSRDP